MSEECDHGSDPLTCPACNRRPKTRKPKSTNIEDIVFRTQSPAITSDVEWQHADCASNPTYVIEAKYHSTCVTCLERIQPGDEITAY